MRPTAASGRRFALAATAALGLTLASVAAVAAHPLGNFTINHYAGLRIGTNAIAVDFVLDMAEIPTFQERTRIDSNGDGTVDAAEIETERLAACPRVASQVTLAAGGVALTLQPMAAGLSFPIGTSGLETLRLVCEFTAPLPSPMTAATSISWEDDTWNQRIGWREIVAVGDGVTIAAGTVPATSVSARLTSYPQDLLSQPLAMQSAVISVTPGGPVAAPFVAPDAHVLPGVVVPSPAASAAPSAAAAASPPAGSGAAGATGAPAPSGAAASGVPGPSAGSATSAVPAPSASPAIQIGVIPGGATEDISKILEVKDLTPLAVIGSLLVAAFLGALHAVSPGHGKTVMAAYLVGSRGSFRHAIALGLTVTFSHTLGVMALAVVTLSASNIIPPERLYPILGVASGGLVVGIGLWLLYGRYRIWRRTRADARGHDAHEREHEAAHAFGAAVAAGAPTAALGSFRASQAPEVRYGGGHAMAMAGGGSMTMTAADASTASAAAAGSGELVRPAGAHDHGPTGHTHDDRTPVPGEHSHGGFRHTHLPPSGADLTWRSLFSLGLAGGLVPSASALLLLLGSLAANRPAYGLVLVVAFGAGMAIVLAGVGLLLVYASRFVERVPRGTMGRRLWDVLPIVTAVVVIGAGIYLTSQAVTQVF